ncbi:GntR family transcriptional regulator [Novispirillum itersonii]|uniref:DNA-binding GntR family transcriptional regulator n=1 Tax=Novispirillum itersonii TaxID=189 RepID=A0A7W9ZFY0_NOVIT|nr:GntR family transcriptional regulator [Novispirillum itersonii]MBB6210685.1 DNA-binding GntR family transcriptional regulator [Novispirillum itersonii]
MTDGLPPIAYETLNTRVYSTLCDAIIKGQFKPGDRLKIRDLAQRLGTSVTPVRDAILRLTHDGALVFLSPRDIRIPVLGMDQYLEIRNIRLRLEALAAETAARKATPEDLDRLRTLITRNEQAIADGNIPLGLELNQAFHFELSVIARMPVLFNTLRRIWLQMGPLVAGAYGPGGRDMIDHHYPVLDALERRDPDAAATAIMQDILGGGQMILAQVRASDSTAP